MYGEIYGVISNEMNTTIIEVGYHDSPLDAYLLKCPSARRVMAMASYQAIVKHLTTNNAEVSPVLLPDPPTHVSAANNGAGNVTLKWHAPVTNRAGGHAATGYVIYRSTNGYGFGNPVAISGGTVTATGSTGSGMAGRDDRSPFFSFLGFLSWPPSTVTKLGQKPLTQE